MWRKLKNLVVRPKNAEPDPWKSALPEISEDVKEIKKLIRRQGLSLELFKKELIGKIDETRPSEPDDLWDLADSFFYLSKSLSRLPDLSESHLQAMDLVWQRLDMLLGGPDGTHSKRRGLVRSPFARKCGPLAGVRRIADGQRNPDAWTQPSRKDR